MLFHDEHFEHNLKYRTHNEIIFIVAINILKFQGMQKIWK